MTKAKVITGKCVSKKNKRMFVFVGNDPVKTKTGWKFEPQILHEVFDKKIYGQIQRGHRAE
jgi:hypothetical protein